MNFGEKENFYERHRYFLQGYSFNFEGLKPTLRMKFENIVTQLSGTVSFDAPYILCDKAYFDRLENQKRTDLFSINFLLDSVVAKKLLDIEKYRYMPTTTQWLESPCCSISKYVLRTNSCWRYYQDNVRCESCLIQNINDDDKTVSVDQEELLNVGNNKINLIDENEIVERKRKTVIAETLSPKKKKSILMIESSPSKVEIHSTNSEAERGLNTAKRIQKSVSKEKLQTVEVDEEVNPIEQEDIVNNIDTSPVTQTKKWWTYLPEPNKFRPVIDTLYDKGERRRGHDYNMNEKRQMIAYLILRNKTGEWRSRQPWRQMHAEGYLNNRSVESLSNQFRKIIYPNIHKFGLPEEILLKF